jgi:hypothetical protein
MPNTQVLKMLEMIRDELREQRKSFDTQLKTIHTVVDTQLTRAVNHFLLVTQTHTSQSPFERVTEVLPAGTIDRDILPTAEPTLIIPTGPDLDLVREQCVALVKNARELAAREIEQAETVATRVLERAMLEAAARLTYEQRMGLQPPPKSSEELPP